MLLLSFIMLAAAATGTSNIATSLPLLLVTAAAASFATYQHQVWLQHGASAALK
jgi:hypothetical protein